MLRRPPLQSLVFLGLFYVLNLGVGALLALPKRELVRLGYFHPQRRWADFYSQRPYSIDVVFLGSSHCYRSFDPEVFDGVFGGRSFNMGSSSQTPLTSYFVLEEVLRSQRPRVVVLETFWALFDLDDQFVNANYNLEFIRSPETRSELRAAAYRWRDWIDVFLPAYRYRDNAHDVLRLALGRGIDVVSPEIYRHDGYVEKGALKGAEAAAPSLDLDRADFIGDPRNLNVAYLREIVRLSRREEIRLILVMAPVSPDAFRPLTIYPRVHGFFEELARRSGVEFYDYNLNDGSLETFSEADFFDSQHLNRNGVRKISADLARRLAVRRGPDHRRSGG